MDTPLDFSFSNPITGAVDKKPIKSEGIEENGAVFIKVEPVDPDYGENDEEPFKFKSEVENITVKAEPYMFDEGSIENVKQEYMETDYDNNDPSDSDSDYKPSKKTRRYTRKVNSESNVKPTFRGKVKKNIFLYSDEVQSEVEIVTITEEERRLEHKLTLDRRRHMRYLCVDCAVGYVVESAYLAHMKAHSPESGDHECEICHCRVKTADALYRHRLRHYRRYRCLVCRSIHKDKETACCHVLSRHAGSAFGCSQCPSTFKRPAYLKRHIEAQHTKPYNLECPKCQRVFHERSWYRIHLRTHNEEVRSSSSAMPFICDICTRSFKNKTNLKRHLSTHNANSETACPVCLQVFKNRDCLKMHFKRNHPQSTVQLPAEATCPHCMRVCVSQGLLNHHIRRMHTDRTKKFQCDYCKRLYLTKSEVRSHISWSHMRARPVHVCTCGRIFRTPCLLRAHNEKFHLKLTPQEKHPCTRCDKVFGSKQVLTRHMKVHSDEKYPCPVCSQTFKTQSYVKIHVKLKHENMSRAEIKAQMKRPKPLRIDPRLAKKVVMKRMKENLEKMQSSLQVPLFTTFVDVAHVS